MTVIFIIIIIFALAVWFIAAPLLRKQPTLSEPNSLRQKRDLFLRKEEVLNNLKELELDHQMKKLNDPDYKNLFVESFQQGAQILKEMGEK